jgi:hypothetical protein
MSASRARQPGITVGDSFAIEQKAINIFKGQLPPKWIPRPHTPDFHLDYLVEVTQKGELTGINFGVQLKGWSPKGTGQTSPRYPLKTKHLRYYIEKCQFPVFVVLVDVRNEKALWCFAQKYGTKFSREQLRLQRTATIEFRAVDDLTDVSRLSQAVRDAAEYMRELYPGSVNAAILRRKQEIEARDKRVTAQVNVLDGKEHIVIQAKEELPFTFKVKTDNPRTMAGVKDFFEKGSDLKLKGNEVKFDGTAIFDEMNASDNREVLIQFHNDREGHALFWWQGSEPDSQVYLPGRFRAGTRYLTFDGSWPSSPLQISFTMSAATLTKGEAFVATIGFRPKEWEGQQLLHLSHFDSCCTLVDAIVGKKHVRLKLFIVGNALGESRIQSKDLGDMARINALLQHLHKARRLCAHFKVNPVFPPTSKFTKEDWVSIEELFAIVFREEHRVAVPGIRLTTTASRTPPLEINQERGNLVISQPGARYTILGESIQAGPVQTQFTDMKLTQVTPKGSDGSAELVFGGTDKSEKVVRRTNTTR